MVLSVCESLLGDAHDAEDAFQAAFLILAKKARSIRDPDLLGNWLYGVARRTAQKAKARRARWRVRAAREEAMCSIAVANGLAEIESVRREETAMLHEEVDRLPESLRAPIVLCYLEGLTHGEAACRLRWPIGTVRSRMARARGLLRARLTRRGLAYAAIVAAIESPRAVRAEVPQALAHATTRSAIELATGTASGLVSTPAATLDEGGTPGHVHDPAQTDRGDRAGCGLHRHGCGDHRNGGLAGPALRRHRVLQRHRPPINGRWRETGPGQRPRPASCWRSRSESAPWPGQPRRQSFRS